MNLIKTCVDFHCPGYHDACPCICNVQSTLCRIPLFDGSTEAYLRLNAGLAVL